ncbi:sensory rhodopsin transducer [Halobacillus campisalis]|uniref:Sensory rhodopsin transducer n=1 Tax=Halobacillus campisalis TaxID=435909 RepID=A0ABW2K8A2_9BACI|nr:sensory rhodopsin transducer [Halobacillus campisalis]
MEIGRKAWIIPDAYTPPESSGKLESHEAICILNRNDQAAHLSIHLYFEDREPIEHIEYVIQGKRTKHLKTDSLHKDGESVPKGIPYAIEVNSDLPIVVQYSRLDATQSENALMTTLGFAQD